MLINHSPPHYLLFDGTLRFGYSFYCRDQPKLELYIIVNSQIHFSELEAVGCKQVVVTRLLRFSGLFNGDDLVIVERSEL
ncbi:unnamed protein product [Brassica oleracea var. botrytis]